MKSIKPGDSIPLAGAITVFEGDVDITSALDLSTWSLSFGLRQVHGPYFYTADIPIEPDGIFSHEVSSDETLGLTVNSSLFYDMRIRDELGTVVSTDTFELLVQPAVSGVPL